MKQTSERENKEEKNRRARGEEKRNKEAIGKWEAWKRKKRKNGITRGKEKRRIRGERRMIMKTRE